MEAQTGQEVPFDAEHAPRGRHLSVRVDADLGLGIEAAAAVRGLPVSEYVRAVLAAAVEADRSTRAVEADRLIRRMEDDLAEVRRRLAG